MRRRHFIRTAVAAATAGVSASRSYGIAQPRHELRDVVVLLPGILGSVLQKDGKDVWALSGGAIVSGLRTLGGSLTTSLRLAGDDPTAENIGGIVATRLIPNTHLLPGLWKVDGYTRIKQTILQTFATTPGENYFEFAYDWRRDNRVAARRLARDGVAWLKAWQMKSGARDARLILVAQSMGGLVARHFLEVLGGWCHTRMLVTFGTPFRGSLSALQRLIEGMAIPGVIDLSDTLRSWTSIYQLLPRYPCYDPGNGSAIRVAEARGIPNVDLQRAKAGLQFHLDIDAARADNEKTVSYRESGYALHTVAGTFQPTLQYARRKGGSVAFEYAFPGQPMQGDGTVPEISATPVEMGTRPPAFPFAERHASLQNSFPILNFLTTVLSRGAIAPAKFQGAGLAEVALMLQDIYPTGGFATIEARCDNPTARLQARVRRLDNDPARNDREVYAAKMARDANGSHVVDVPGLTEGTYRVTVAGGAKVGAASDVFLVAGS